MHRRIGLLTLAAGLAVLCLVGSASAQYSGDRVAHVTRGEQYYEIDVTSTTPFPIRAMAPILYIGDQAFGMSRYTDAYSRYGLTFLLTDAQYAALPEGATARVAYGAPSAGHTWELGTFNRAVTPR